MSQVSFHDYEQSWFGIIPKMVFAFLTKSLERREISLLNKKKIPWPTVLPGPTSQQFLNSGFIFYWIPRWSLRNFLFHIPSWWQKPSSTIDTNIFVPSCWCPGPWSCYTGRRCTSPSLRTVSWCPFPTNPLAAHPYRTVRPESTAFTSHGAVSRDYFHPSPPYIRIEPKNETTTTRSRSLQLQYTQTDMNETESKETKLWTKTWNKSLIAGGFLFC